MRSRVKVALIAAAALSLGALSACSTPGAPWHLAGGNSDAGATPAPSETAAPVSPEGAAAPVNDPLDLIDMWRVSDAGEGADTWLRLDAGGLQLWRDCGVTMGSWRAAGSAFVASVYASTGGCSQDVGWLDEAVAYESVDGGWALRDSAGDVVATLAVDGAPTPSADVSEAYAEAPVVDDEARKVFPALAGMPDGLRPVESADLVGRWVPQGGPVGEEHVEFHADGRWSGSDGCNGGAGRFSAANGEIIATAGVSTLIGCDGAPVPAWVSQASLAGFDGETLVLLDAEAGELGRLVRG